jgi:MFS family permease
MGPYFSIDNPAELEYYIELTYDIPTVQYSLLYSLYALPNMFLPLFGGIILDKIGLHTGLLITSSFVTCG